MATAKSMMDANRQKQRRAEDEEYLGSPSKEADLIQARLVIPGKQMLPAGLDEPGALDDIRKMYQAYITFMEPNVLDIQCKSISQLQQAVHAINWALHDMRRSVELPPVKFFVQQPAKASINDMVRVVIGCRPQFTSHLSMPSNNILALEKCLPKMSTDIASSADNLMALNKQLKMRVNFGCLNIRARNTKGRDEISYHEFVKLMDMYSIRGGASLRTRLPEAKEAEQLIWYLVDPERNICGGPEELMHGYEVTLAVQDQEIKAESMEPMGQRMQLSMVRAIRPEAWAHLNWIVAAPDRAYDWSLTVNAWENLDTPAGFNDLSKKLKIEVDQDWESILKIPKVDTRQLGDLQNQIRQIGVKSSVVIPYKLTPYVIEINITRAWQEGRMSDEPQVTWGIEFYASHWDESINHVCGGERRKDWGQGLKSIWPGDEPSLGLRFEEFLQTVLEVQSILEDAQSCLASQ
ncbi:hypothetical protein BGZ63DRAFT_412686 [Mariannaea sp. PMI_226]|nr:hypothetical protein BGZ63DRAFT_412686 [Mariannaea sp. PMI_226]